MAKEYATNFAGVIHELLPSLERGIAAGWSLTEAIIRTHVEAIAAHGDSLIRRKSGPAIDEQAKRFATACLAAGSPGDDVYHAALADFDFWLRSDGRKRNPGTTADLIAAALFVGLREGRLPPPWK